MAKSLFRRFHIDCEQFRILGDVHGELNVLQSVMNTLDDHEHLIQLGDLSMRANDWEFVEAEYKYKLSVLGGNQDNYDWIESNRPQVYLGDYGLINEKIFYIRGAYSKDYLVRLEWEKDDGLRYWFKQEEIGLEYHKDIALKFEEFKPDIVITHDCPTRITKELCMIRHHVFTESYTGNLLDRCLTYHQPKVWFFGHYQEPFTFFHKATGTTFSCVGTNYQAVIL